MVCFSDTRVRELEGDVFEICLSSDTTGTCAALSLPHCYISPVICNLCWSSGTTEDDSLDNINDDDTHSDI